MIEHIERKTDEATENNLRAIIVRYEADTYNAVALLQIAPNPLNPQDGKAVGVVVGGLGKRQGIAKDLFGACLAECNVAEENSRIAAAVRMAYAAADAILAGDKENPPGFAE